MMTEDKNLTIKEMMNMAEEDKLDFDNLCYTNGFNEINTVDYFINEYNDKADDLVRKMADQEEINTVHETIYQLQSFKNNGIEFVNYNDDKRDDLPDRFEIIKDDDVQLLNNKLNNFLED